MSVRLSNAVMAAQREAAQAASSSIPAAPAAKVRSRAPKKKKTAAKN